jgi:hypothetical protein
MAAVQPLAAPPSPHAAPAPGKGDAGGSSPARPGQPESRDVGTSSPPVPPQRVSLGFASPALPAQPSSAERSLAAGAQHLFWVELAPELVAGSLRPAPPALPSLRPGDELDVILFPFPDQLVLEGARHGRLQLGGAGARVVKPAAEPEALPGPASTRLYFAVRTPDKAGRFALRCNLYCRGVLLQSHLVSVEVAERPRRHPGALRRALDYNLSAGLDTRRLTPSDDCRLSLFINDDDHGTHSFRFVSSKDGAPEQIADAHLEGSKLNEMIDYARGALRWSAWGTEAPWRPGEACKFSSVRDHAQLGEALILMAKRGANLWMELAAQFSFVGPGAHQLREHMRAPGRVQIALKDSPDAVIPAALLYDHPLDAARSDVSLCPASLAAIAAGKPLAGEPCFLGHCPSYADTSVVCPAGFWGFRHDLGLPLHLPGGEVATAIPRGERVRAFAPISTDVAFVKRSGHFDDLAKLSTQLAARSPRLAADWLEVLDSRDACLKRLPEGRQLVYFYCHGGVMAGTKTPFLQVGPPGSDPIYAQSLFEAKISWRAPLRPLVILNGCHTTATSPDAMFSMLTAFASHCNAAGIIGTEITNFESIAGVFGHELLRRFLDGEPLGHAVRMARLELLRGGNPLGLMYIPFALPSLHLA